MPRLTGILTQLLGLKQRIGYLLRSRGGKMRENEAYFRLVFENSGDAILFAWPDGRIESANPAASRIFGYSNEQFRTLGRSGIMDTSDPRFGEFLQERSRTGRYFGELRGIHRDGRIIDIELNSTCFVDAKGDTRTINQFRNISDRKRVEKVLLLRENLQRALFDSFPFLVSFKDRNSRFVEVNHVYAMACGHESPDQLVGKTDLDVWPSELAEAYRAGDEQVLESGKPRFVEEQVQIGGKLSWFESHKSPVIVDGQIVGLICYSRDISERKTTEEGIRSRVIALTQPLDISQVAFHELFSRDDIQRIQDEFSVATGVASVITLPDGTPFTKPSNFTQLCFEIIRKTELGCSNCIHSDRVIGSYHPAGPVVQHCLSGGLWDAGVSIIVDGHHVANWLIGQVRDDSQTVEGMRAYAQQIGADETAFLQAFQAVPVMSRERFEVIAKSLSTLANELSKTAFHNLQQARFIVEREQSEKGLQLAASVFSHAREGIMITDTDGTIIKVNDAFSRITGFDGEEVVGKTPGVLGSGRESASFYANLWRELKANGHWSGEVWNRRKSGELFCVMQTISTVRNGQGDPSQYVSLFSDITAIKEHEKQLEHIAYHDMLTSLPNRALLADRLKQAMLHAERRGQILAVAYIDLDGFKAINDTYGHMIGDRLLIVLSDFMKRTLGESDTLARLGGDEFVAVLVDLPDETACLSMLNRLLAIARQPAPVGDLLLQASASIGATFFPQSEPVDADQLLRQADQAMYQAKLTGKNSYHVFDAEQDRNVRSNHESLVDIQRALGANEFVLRYQPKVNMRTGAVVGVEALIRWQHPARGLLPPAGFLPVIEDHPLAIDIGEWVINTALTQMETWSRSGLDLKVSVNVGARQLLHGNFVSQLGAILAAHPSIPPGRLAIEILETSALEDLEKASGVIERCREKGIAISLDDFGTGYSSLTYLKRLSVDQLKIDRTFVRDMLDDPDDLSILGGVLGLATAFRREVIAEGVETVEHGTMLLQLGCELAQGFGIARQMPADDIPAWVNCWRQDAAWSSLPAVSHDDLPILFAVVEHRAWLIALESFLKGNRKSLPLVHQQCRLDVWLAQKGPAHHERKLALNSVAALHRQIHALADELSTLNAQGKNADALARLDELHRMRDHFIQQLHSMVEIPRT